jgi:hypothetical protein
MIKTSDHEDCFTLFLRLGVPVTLGDRNGRATITIRVPDETAGRVTAQHSGVSITFNFINGRFVGLVRDKEGGP